MELRVRGLGLPITIVDEDKNFVLELQGGE